MMKKLKNKILLTFLLVLLSINKVFADVTAPIVEPYEVEYHDAIIIFCIILVLIIILIAILIVKKRKEIKNEKNK